MQNYTLFFLLLILAGCWRQQPKVKMAEDNTLSGPDTSVFYQSIGDIQTPESYKRLPAAPGSFTVWLRSVPLKKDKRVFLYNGSLKPNQSAQFAVADISVGNKGLQQCADVVIRLRAEYLYTQKMYKDIAFMDYNGKWYRWTGGASRSLFDNYLQTVFGWCGSASLDKQLKPVTDFNNIEAGDVFIKGGFPGHAMLVMDIAVNETGRKIFILAQGYQPAQDIHVVINPMNDKLSPWYGITDTDQIITPEWKFMKSNLKTW